MTSKGICCSRLLILIEIFMLSTCSAYGNDRWLDLTHAFNEHSIYWPTEKGFQFYRGTNSTTAKGYFYAANRFSTAEHGGTHLDAPYHFSSVGQTVEAIPVQRCIGEGVVIDVTAQAAMDRDYQVSVNDLRSWEDTHHQQLVDVILLLRTGWASKWNDRTAYLGTHATGTQAIAELSFPGLAPDAARWLVDHRRVKAIGIDTASIDHGPSVYFESHVILCGGNIPIFENVASLACLPPKGSFVVALPMKIEGGSGGPLRIIARIP